MRACISIIFSTVVLSISSFGQTCLLDNMNVTSLACHADNSYNVSLTVTPDSLDLVLFLNGSYYSDYNYDTTAIFIDSIADSGMSQDTFVLSYPNAPDSCALELLVNNPCYCGFNNFEYTIFDCSELLENYYVRLDFDYYNNGDAFNLVSSQGGNATYNYADLPIEIGPFSTANGGLNLTFLDFNDPSCFLIEDLEEVDCAIVNACTISNLIAEAQDCMVDGNFFVDIEFDVHNEGPDGFLVQGNGNSYGNFDYGQAFYTVGPLSGDCSTIYEFVVTDIADGNCNDFYELNEPVCCQVVPCELSDLVFSPICDGIDLLGFNLDFNFSGNVSSTFTVSIDQQNVGTYSYSDLPLNQSLGTIVIDDLILDILIVDSNDPNCAIEFNGFEVICLSECVISNVEAQLSPCDGNLYSVELGFDVRNAAGTTYSVMGNGTDYGSFNYTQNPIVLGPFEADCLTILEFIVVDDLDMSCSEVFEFTEPVCCDDCEISDLTADLISCTMDSVSFTINFNQSNSGGVGFDVYSRNGLFGFYNYASLPLTISGFPNTGAAFEFVKVCDNDNPDCCQEIEFLLENCLMQECEISEVEVELLECDEDEVSFVLSFDYVNNTGATFDLFSRDGFFGTFNYTDLPITVMGFPNTGELEEFVNICDNDNPDCCIDYEFLLENCQSQECEISEVEVELLECDEDEVSFVLSFNYVNNTGATFDLFSRDGFFGSFNYTDLPLTVMGFPNTGELEEFVNICDNDNPDCCINFEFLLENCLAPCELWDLNIEFVECDQDSVWYQIDFQSSNVGQQGFNLEVNNMQVGNYDYNDLPLTLSVVLNTNDDRYDFQVSDIDSTACVLSEFTFLEMECTSSNINLTETEFIAFYNGSDLFVKSEKDIKELMLYSYLGQRLESRKNVNVLSAINYKPGIYLLRIKTERQDLLKKVLIQ